MSAEDCVGCRHINNCLGDCVGYEKIKPHKQTNEEWFCSLSTEKKVEFSMRVFKNCTWCLDGGNPQECPFNAFLDCPAESKENMMKWLKGIHT